VITPIAQISTGLPCPASNREEREKGELLVSREYRRPEANTLFLKISGAMYYRNAGGRVSIRRRPVYTSANSETHPRCTADLSEHRELILIHDPAKAEIGDHHVRVLCRRAEDQVLRLEVCDVE
jgi:hypothetical protein